MASINSCSQTSLSIKTITHKWTIDNFSALTETGLIYELSLTSPTFPSDSSDLQFHLELCLDIHVTICLVNEKMVNSINRGNVKIWLEGQPNGQSTARHKFQECLKRNPMALAGLLQNKNTFLFDDKLIIHCEITFIQTSVNKSGHYCTLENAENCKLVEDFRALLEAEELADVTIVTARSNVFAAMFKHSLRENAENCVTISDISSVVLMEMLRFIYTGEAPNLKDMAVNLMAAADKYGLDGLKEMCAKSMSDNLSIETSPLVLKAADLYNVEDLKSEAIQFIRSNLDEITQTSIWKHTIETDRKLILESFIDQKFFESKVSDDNLSSKEQNVKTDNK